MLVVRDRSDERELVVEFFAKGDRTRGLPIVSICRLRKAKVATEKPIVTQRHRVPSLQVDQAADTTFNERRIRRLVDIHAGQEFSRNTLQRVRLAVPAFTQLENLKARKEQVPIEDRFVLLEAANADFRPLTIFAINLNTWESAQ